MKELTIHPSFMKDVDAYVQSRMVDGKISSGDVLKAEAFAYNELKNTKNFADENKRKLAIDVVKMAVGGQNRPPPMGEYTPSPLPPVLKPVKKFSLLGLISCFFGGKSSVEVVVPVTSEALSEVVSEVVAEVVSEVAPLVVREVAEVVDVAEAVSEVVREAVVVAEAVSVAVAEVVSETAVVAEAVSVAVAEAVSETAVVAEVVSEAVSEAVSVAEVVPELSPEQPTESEERGWRGLA